MFKKLIVTFAIFFLFGVFAVAQDKPETTNTETKECSKNCCASKEMHSNMTMDGSKETNNHMEHMKSDSTMKGMHHEKDSDSMHKNSIVREGTIDLKSIDKNKDGKVFQDQMCWNVISDKPGECPQCGMILKEVSLEKAKENLVKNEFKVTDK